MSNVTWEEKKYKYFGRCLFVSNGELIFAAALDFGIRILYFARAGRANFFYEQPKDAVYLSTKEGWRVYGGHRLAFAPENDKVYWPDNVPVRFTALEDGVLLEQEQDPWLSVEKSVELRFTGKPLELSVLHRIRNVGKKVLKGASWAITAVRAGGTMTVPFIPPVEFTGKPSRFVSLWNNTSLTDERLHFKKDSIELKQIPMDDYFKMGVFCSEGLIRYRVEEQEFQKRFEVDMPVTYPDSNVNIEFFACRYMMELETLTPLNSIQPGAICEHREIWSIH
jgi:hypothetical protein